MSNENRTKLNRMLRNWGKGTVATTPFMKQYEIDYDLIKRYKKSNWIEAVGTGAYKLVDDEIDWYGAIYALQNQMDLTVHPGAKTALQLLGYSHYLSDKINNLYLLGNRGEKLPAWYRKYDWKVKTIYSANQLLPQESSLGYTEHSHKNFEIRISAPERAMIEMLYYFPKHHSFQECYKIMENMVALRPDLCQKLLEKCNSIKVKRLFLFMADKIGHNWFDDLVIDKIDLGSGKRKLVDNGAFNKKYNITVPKEYN